MYHLAFQSCQRQHDCSSYNAPVEDLCSSCANSTDTTQSDLATSILKSAYGHQQNALDKHLGVGPSKSGTDGLNQFKNLSKAKAILDERRAKKVEAQLKQDGIKVVATQGARKNNIQKNILKIS